MSVVFADVDTGIDDALAVIYLLASPDADLVGIASTGGNIAVGQVCANNLSLLELCGAADIPVSKGADEPLGGRWPDHPKFHGPKGIGYAELPASNRRLSVPGDPPARESRGRSGAWGDWCPVCIGSHFWQVNWLTSMYPMRNISAQPVRYFIYRS